MEKKEQKTALGAAYNGVVPNTPIRFLIHVSKPHKWWALGAFAAVTVAQSVGTSVPYIFKSIIDSAQAVTAAGSSDYSDVWFWAVAYVIAVTVLFIGYRSSGLIGLKWATGANATAYNVLFRYLSLHSHEYFSNRFAGSLSSKVSHASEGTQSLAEAFVWNYYSTTLSVLLTVMYIAYVNLLAAAFFVVLLLILIPLNMYLAKYRRPFVVGYSEQATRARGYAVDAITNIAAVRQFTRRADEHRLFGEEIDKMRRFNIRQWSISEWILALNNVIIILFEALVVFVAVHSWTTQSITVGELVMVITLMINVQGSLVFIGNSMNGFIRRYGEIEEGLTDILVDYEVTDLPGATTLKTHKGQIEWKKVSFSYESYQVFEDLDLTIEPGQRVGLVGSSGAGKSTFVSLLLRQHDIQGGSILIDGQNIAEVTQDSLREHISVVPQEPMLFHRSIRENIAYGKPTATDDEIIEVAKKAQAHDFIQELPQGYDTLVGERGVKLSGGQRQRIAIARAMLKNAPILVLDEATSSLDSESEVAIQKALHELMEGKTVVAIAHRLSTLREMDRLLVLENGVIVEDGTHGSLVSKGGTYSRLWAHQAGGFLQE